MRFLPYGEVFIPSPERSRSPQGPRFIAKRASRCRRSAIRCRREGGRIPERLCAWTEIRYVRLSDARNKVGSGTCTCCVASTKQDSADSTLGFSLTLRWCPGMVAEDG